MRSVWDREVGGSNPLAPTRIAQQDKRKATVDVAFTYFGATICVELLRDRTDVIVDSGKRIRFAGSAADGKTVRRSLLRVELEIVSERCALGAKTDSCGS